MLEVRGLSVSYGQHRALENVSLRVGRGEIVVILGANGAGKSTLLKALAGICEGKASGSVSLGGGELLGRKPHDIVEAGLALVPEGRGVFGDLTVQENLLLGAYSERARDEEAGNLERVLSLFPKLAERRKQAVRTMSGGEQQMVAIGRAMMSSPEILALDEPSLGLSPLLCKDLFQSLLAVKKAGLGVLLVEQNAKQSLRIADRGYLLENGSIVHEDTADSMAKDPAVQKAYLGGGGGRAAPKTTPPRAVPSSSIPRPARGPSPGDIAAAALKGVTAPTRPTGPASARPVADAGPAPRPSTPASAKTSAAAPQPVTPPVVPDIGDLVARASAKASRRPNGKIPPRPHPPAQLHRATPEVTPTPVSGAPVDRLRAMLDEIEAAARRAESYRPGPTRR